MVCRYWNHPYTKIRKTTSGKISAKNIKGKRSAVQHKNLVGWLLWLSRGPIFNNSHNADTDSFSADINKGTNFQPYNDERGDIDIIGRNYNAKNIQSITSLENRKLQ